MTGNTTVELGKFGAYHGIKITTTFSAMENPPKGVNRSPRSWAMPSAPATSPVPSKAKPFPLYAKGEDCVTSQGKKEFCPGKPFVYAELINTSKYTLKPKERRSSTSPTATDSRERGCASRRFYDARTEDAGGWAPNETLGGQPHGTTLTINAQPNPGQLIYRPDSLSSRVHVVGPGPSTAALRASAQDDIRRASP